jgi:vitamin B12 transporter
MHNHYFKSLLITGLLFNAFCFEANAQDSARVLNTVVVTATRSPKKLSEIGRVVTIISAEEINRSQGKSLPQLLNTVPGITFSGAQNAPGIATSIYLRGASNGNTLILIDGFPANNASSIDGGYDLNAFPTDQIERIEILKGSGSTLYGSDAVAGVINIITKHAKGQGIKANAQLAGGSYSTFKEAAGINGRLNKTGLAVNLSNTDSKGFAAATDKLNTGEFTKDGFHQRSANVNIDQQISESFLLTGNLQATYNKGNLPNGAFSDDKDYNYDNKFWFGGLGAKIKLTRGSFIFNVTKNTVKNNFKNLPSDNYGTHQETKNTGQITTVEEVLTYNLGKYFDITSGAAYKYSSTSQYSLFEQPGYTPGPQIINKDTANNSIASIYTSVFFKTGIFHMELGGRYNQHSKFGDKFTYTINPSLLLADQFKIFVTAASAFKAPSLYQLASQYRNPDLKPESTNSYEAGFDWEIIKSTLSFNTSFFKRKTTNVIYFKNLNSFPFGIYENGALQNDKGFESELNYTAHKLSASAWYAYVTGKQTDIKGLATANLFRRPKNSFGAKINYEFVDKISAGLIYKYTGDRSELVYNEATFKSEPVALKHYNLVDLHVEANITKQLNLYGDLQNVLNEKYIDWVGYNTRGINFMLGAKYQFK